MKITDVNEKEKSTVELIVEVEPAVFEEALEKAFRKNRRSIAVHGFRPGKAPRKIIERMYGADIFHEEAIDTLGPELFEQAVKEKGLKTVGNPSIDAYKVSEDKILTLTFVTAVYPPVVLGQYKDLEAEKAIEPVKQEDIDAELNALRERNASIQAVERAAKEGDIAVIDFEGFLEGKAFEGGKGEAYDLALGSGSFVPGFEEQVIGMQAGEEKEIALTFPEDYAEELKGRDVVFQVKCREVKEKNLPELDDEFAKDVSEFDTLKEYQNSIKARIENERANRAESLFKDAIMKLAVENMEVDAPDAMVERTLDGMMQEFYHNVSSQGMNPEQYLAMMGMTVEGFRENSRETALARVKTGLLLEAVAEAEGFQAEDADIEAEYARLAEQYGRPLEEIKKVIDAEGLSSDVLRKKAADLIYESAKVAEAKPAKEAKKPKTAKKTEEAEPAKETKKPKAAKKTEEAKAAKVTKEAKAVKEADKPKKAKPAAKAAKEEE